MSKRAERALKQSIKHWEKDVLEENIFPRANNCPLCKLYNNNAHCYLNVPKFKELIDLSETTLLPSYFLFREYDRWGYIMIHDGFNIVCKYNTKLTGGTPNGREANPDDIEPIIVLNKENIIWGN